MVENEARARELHRLPRPREAREGWRARAGQLARRDDVEDHRQEGVGTAVWSSRPTCRARSKPSSARWRRSAPRRSAARNRSCRAPGAISESDVMLAKGANSAIHRLQRPRLETGPRPGRARRRRDPLLRDHLRPAGRHQRRALGHAGPDPARNLLGNAEVLQAFDISKIGRVAGCRVTEGVVPQGRPRPDHPRRHRGPRAGHPAGRSSASRTRSTRSQSGVECGMASPASRTSRPRRHRVLHPRRGQSAASKPRGRQQRESPGANLRGFFVFHSFPAARGRGGPHAERSEERVVEREEPSRRACGFPFPPLALPPAFAGVGQRSPLSRKRERNGGAAALLRSRNPCSLRRNPGEGASWR